MFTGTAGTVREYSLTSPFTIADVSGEHSGDVIDTTSTDNQDTDPDSDTLTITSIIATTAGGSAQTTFSSNTEAVTGSYGILTINSNGSYQYAATLDATDALDAGDVVTDTPFTDKVREQNPGVELRGDETFGELTEKLGKSKDQGLGSLYPKGEPGEIFDTANSKRAEMAAFMKAMREAGIKNEDVINTAKITDVAEGKRAATTLARAAETGADTKIKQEILSELDEQVMDKGPRFFQEEYMGYDSMGNLLENITTTVNNGIYDDLIEQGVPEDKVSSIFQYIASVRNNMKYDPKAVLRKIADDIEMEDIKYDTTFWDNYIDEILSKIQKPAPRFADGGLV